METRWTERADRSLDVIFDYYKEKSEQAANRIIGEIIDSSRRLTVFPQMAPVEPSLGNRSETFRALSVKNRYKIIYYVDAAADEIVIVTVWDCRRSPEGLTDLAK
ncbi:MAG: type II toxin-antitoxin system RelE/ParE family toxin [Candidatus Symbiothrix sp.]|jgi:plasmid stabilization system protein ParE|nr:type II toxin-antitoxin system RelE/ParE family toxin [Candidatus Symbiothrix sp.]